MSRIQFRCPKCGDSKFGSSRNEDGSLTRYCHGQVLMEPPIDAYAQCDYSAHESDDYKHFVLAFETPAQFAGALMSEQGLVGTAVQAMKP
jgi:hypothetical protein